ncbi:hypothetical protein K5X82_03060 [Halosquirtibacter xylanolyticus]|uniref:hypothetical protein n=1 Tax=Halosquirtibacter xylanolyticus TaxID=3374599 RepID=UPI003748E6CA|nr:hypothetical protein K5X82_03060 [Prolixibacteraceae bacterium]
MKFIELTEEEVLELRNRYHNSDNKVERHRSHCLLLSSEGFTISDIIGILKTSRRTVERLFLSWEECKYKSLRIKKGRDPKYILTPYQAYIDESIKEHSRNI